MFLNARYLKNHFPFHNFWGPCIDYSIWVQGPSGVDGVAWDAEGLHNGSLS